MRPPQLIEAGIVLSLAVTLAAKIASVPSMPGAETQPARATPVAMFLERQGFTVAAPPPNVDPEMLPANKADCSLRIGEVSPLGWHRDVLAQLAGPHEQVRFAF